MSTSSFLAEKILVVGGPADGHMLSSDEIDQVINDRRRKLIEKEDYEDLLGVQRKEAGGGVY